jgi:hypothetical protein
MKFTYNSGQRPLDGYTLKRGIGRGGFGEVYYAVSDGGKEVALKLVRGNLEVELRGMAQCLNLKHPHLVSLYDMRTDPQGDHWVIMEYIAGEPLNVVLNRHPQGLPQDLARQWFVALAQAVAYLHDHGIVHRDLKPANIFVETGIVKVGDYGLCKFISGSQRTAQTQSVGTVHYMAPEISTGNYNKQIDIYAAGVILYEMLTGHVPFDGESAGEILMKHLTAPPDMAKVPPIYAPLVSKALAKNPAHRFLTLGEMAKALEETGRQQAQPQASARPATPVPPPIRPAAQAARPVPPPIPTVLPAAPSVRAQVAELCGSLAMAAVLAVVASMLLAAVGHDNLLSLDVRQELFLMIASSWAVLIPAKFWANMRGDSWTRRSVMMVLGVCVGMFALWLDGWSPRMRPDRDAVFAASGPSGTQEITIRSGPTVAPPYSTAQYVSYFALAFFALRWWRLAERRRPHRFSFAPVLAAGFWGLILLLVWRDPWRGTVVLTTTAAIVQLVSPWEPPIPAVARRVRLRYA